MLSLYASYVVPLGKSTLRLILNRIMSYKKAEQDTSSKVAIQWQDVKCFEKFDSAFLLDEAIILNTDN